MTVTHAQGEIFCGAIRLTLEQAQEHIALADRELQASLRIGDRAGGRAASDYMRELRTALHARAAWLQRAQSGQAA